MKKLWIMVFLLKTIIVFSLETSVDLQTIPNLVTGEFYEVYAKDLPIVLEITAGRFTVEIANQFKTRLLSDGYRLYERRTEDCLVISLSYYAEPISITKRSLFSQNVIQQTIHNFIYQVTSYPEGEIVSYNNLSFHSHPVKQKSGLRWFDPLIITAIVGGLVYLLYFGE